MNTDEKDRRDAAIIQASEFQLSSDIGNAIKLAREEFNHGVQTYPDRLINVCNTGGQYIAYLGKTHGYPKIYVTLSINPTTQRLNVTAQRVTQLGTEDLPPLNFLLKVVEGCVEIHDKAGFIRHTELAARLLRYFV